MSGSNSQDNMMNIVKGVAAAVGVGAALGLAFYAVNEQTKASELEKKVKDWVNVDFCDHKTEIVYFCQLQNWNYFSRRELKRIFYYFSTQLDNPQRGVISHKAFSAMCEGVGVSDEKQTHLLYTFWALKKPGMGFLEVVRRLNLICFGTLSQILDAFFDLYDLNYDNKLDVPELEHLINTFYQADNNFAALDSKRQDTSSLVFTILSNAKQTESQVLTREDFVHLASHSCASVVDPRSSPFTRHFLHKFGVTAERINSM